MRTTIRIDDGLFRELKRYSAETERTMTSVIEEALREVLSRRKKQARPRRVKLPVHGSGGLRPGVDLDRSADLWDLLDLERGSP